MKFSLFPSFPSYEDKQKYSSEKFTASIENKNKPAIMLTVILLSKLSSHFFFPASSNSLPRIIQMIIIATPAYLLIIFGGRYKRAPSAGKEKIIQLLICLVEISMVLFAYDSAISMRTDLCKDLFVASGFGLNTLQFYLIGKSFFQFLNLNVLFFCLMIYEFYGEDGYTEFVSRTIIVCWFNILSVYATEYKMRSEFIKRNTFFKKNEFYETFLRAVKIPIFIISKSSIEFQNDSAKSNFNISNISEFINYFGDLTNNKEVLLIELLNQGAYPQSKCFHNIVEDEFIQSRKHLGSTSSERFFNVIIIGGGYFGRTGTLGLSIKETTEDKILQRSKITEEYTNSLICGISHELRSPLNAIMGMIKLAKETATCQNKQHLKIALNSSSILFYKINDILDYAQIISKVFRLHNSVINIIDLIKTLRKICESEKQDKSIQLEFQVDQEIKFITGDSQRLIQILLNLLLNAIKFTEKGFVRLLVSKMRDSKIQFKIKDSGIGMNRQQQKNLFTLNCTNSFFLNKSVLKDRTTGLPGIGLTVSNLICKEMRTRLKCRTSLGKGTTFSFGIKNELAVPTHQERQERVESSTLIPEERFTTINSSEDDGKLEKTYKRLFSQCLVIIADDMNVNRLVIHSFLKGFNIACLEAANGVECVDIVMKNLEKRIVIFMDLQMPQMDGIEATQIIRSSQNINLPPYIVAVTAFASEVEKEKCMSAGMNGFLMKPVFFDEIKQTLKKFQTSCS